MEKLKTIVGDIIKWIKKHLFRKHTTPVHYIAGIFIGILGFYNIGLAIILFTAFGWYEYRQGVEIPDTGLMDFWEGMAGVFIGAGIGLLLLL